jgi:outer membrane protein OmpA-like peptidoglycan-associated protein
MTININFFNKAGFQGLIVLVSSFFTGVAMANAVGPHTKTFNPTGSSEDFVSVHSGRSSPEGTYHLGLFMDLATNTSPYFQSSDSSLENEAAEGSLTKINDYVLFADIVAGYSFNSQLSLWIYAPVVLHTQIKETRSIYGEFNNRGISQLRLGPKYTFFESDTINLATIFTLGLNTVKENPYTGSGQALSTTLELAGDFRPLNKLILGANTGLRFAQTGSAASEYVNPYSHSFLYSLAGAYEFVQNYAGVVEIFGSTPLQKEMDLSDRHTTTLESLYGLKIRQDATTTIHAGLGTEIRHGVSSADLRLYAGMQKSFGASTQSQDFLAAPKETDFADNSADLWVSDLSMRDKADEILVVQSILFGLNSSRYEDPSSAHSELANLKRSLESDGGFKTLMIEGHTCTIGNRTYNNKLSRERAARIKRTLVREHNVPAHKIKIAGYGERFPIQSNRTEDGRRENRRVEFRIYR